MSLSLLLALPSAVFGDVEAPPEPVFTELHAVPEPDPVAPIEPAPPVRRPAVAIVPVVFPLPQAAWLSDAKLDAVCAAGSPAGGLELARRLRHRARLATTKERAVALENDARNAEFRALMGLRRQADAGNVEAGYWVGEFLRRGLGGEVSVREASACYRRAANSGSPAACLRMAVEEGNEALLESVTKSGARLAKVAEAATREPGAPEAAWRAAMWELSEADNLERWSRLAADGDVDAQVEYALLLLRREADAVPDRANRTVFKAWKLLEAAAHRDRVRAMHALWPLYMTSFCDIPKDPEAAYRLAKRASDLGYGPAHAWLHRRFATGDHWAANPEEAARYGRLAAEAGALPVTLGCELLAAESAPSPLGVPPPFAPRDAWLDRAAEGYAATLLQGGRVPLAHASLLLHFRNRVWVKALAELSPEIAAAAACGDWDRMRVITEMRFAEAGDPEALGFLAYRTMRGLGVRHDFARAQALATQSAEQGNTVGLMTLAIMAGRGCGCEPSAVESAKWRLLAGHHAGELSPEAVRAALPAPLTDAEYADACRRAEAWLAAHRVE